LQVGLYNTINDEYNLCFDLQSCQRQCHTPKCDLGKTSFGELFIKDVLDFSISINKLNNDTQDVENFLNSYDYRNLTKDDINDIIKKIIMINEDSSSVNSNPLLSPVAGGLKIGFPIDYKTEYLQDMINELTENIVIYNSTQNTSSNGISYVYTQPPLKHVEYTVIIEIYHRSESPYSKITVEEQIPWTVNNVIISSNYTKFKDNKIIWELSQVGSDEAPGYIIYAFDTYSPLSNESVASINSPKITVESAEVENTPIVLFSLSVINNLTSFLFLFGSFFAIGIFAGLLGIIIRYVVWVFELVWEIINGILSHKNIKQIFYDWLGSANPNYVQYIGLSILLILIAGVITYNSTAKSFDSLSSLQEYILKNPIGTFGSFLVFLSVISLYFGIEEYVKLKLFGAPEVKGDLKNRNIKSLEHLKTQIERIHNLLNKASSMRIDTNDEEELLLSIPIKRITQLIYEIDDQQQARILSEQSISRAEYCIKLLNQKIDTMTNKWPEWESIILSRLEKENEVDIDDLIEIPKEWRELSIERFLILHPEKNLIIDKGTLKPMSLKAMKVPISKIPFSVAKYKVTGEIENYPFTTGNRSLIGILLHRMMKYLRLLDTPVSHVKVKGIFVQNINGKGRKTVMFFLGNVQFRRVINVPLQYIPFKSCFVVVNFLREFINPLVNDFIIVKVFIVDFIKCFRLTFVLGSLSNTP